MGAQKHHIPTHSADDGDGVVVGGGTISMPLLADSTSANPKKGAQTPEENRMTMQTHDTRMDTIIKSMELIQLQNAQLMAIQEGRDKVIADQQRELNTLKTELERTQQMYRRQVHTPTDERMEQRSAHKQNAAGIDRGQETAREEGQGAASVGEGQNTASDDDDRKSTFTQISEVDFGGKQKTPLVTKKQRTWIYEGVAEFHGEGSPYTDIDVTTSQREKFKRLMMQMSPHERQKLVPKKGAGTAVELKEGGKKEKRTPDYNAIEQSVDKKLTEIMKSGKEKYTLPSANRHAGERDSTTRAEKLCGIRQRDI
jgi:hypothetical protein